MKKYVEFTSKHKKPLLAILVIINILAVIGLVQIKISPNFDIFTPNKSEYKDNMDYMNQNFTSSDSLIIMAEIDSESLKLEDFRAFAKITEAPCKS